jgi:hypothetical protein
MNDEGNGRRLLWMKMGIAAVLVALAAALRVVAHPWNFTPIGAMALFSGATFRQRWMKFAFPLVALFAGDLFVGIYKLMFVVYLSFLVSVAIGVWIGEERKLTRLAGGTLIGALQFFLVTNFAVWAAFRTYPKTGAGSSHATRPASPSFGILWRETCFTQCCFSVDMRWPSAFSPPRARLPNRPAEPRSGCALML